MNYTTVNTRTINLVPFKFRPDIIGSWKIVNFQTGLTVVISFQYKPVIDKAWKYLAETALQADGSVGYVQPIGEKPDPTRTVNAQSQAPFGTGAWLLAACEYYRYMK